jgi:hypothetical protein
MDSSEDWEEKEDAEKRSGYAPVWISPIPYRRNRLDYDPVQLYGEGSLIDLQYGPY